MLDLLIQNVSIVDGSGAPTALGCVGCRDGALVMNPPADTPAREVIDGRGLHVTPGVIDTHSHGDLPLGKAYNSLAKLSQGVTTHVGGQCGFSVFPVDPGRLAATQDNMAILTDEFPAEMGTFTSFSRYLAYAGGLPLPENIAFLMGHGSLRIAAMGFDNRPATPYELDHMKQMLEDALHSGVFGLSSGLIYIPGVYAPKEELTALCRILAKHDAVYATHIRDESDFVLQSLEEAIQMGRQTGCRVHVSHLKACGKKNHGLSEQMLDLIHRANAEGICVTADQYPYNAGMTHLNTCIPPAYFSRGVAGMVAHLKSPETRREIRSQMQQDGGGYENFYLSSGGWPGILVAAAENTPEAEGKTIAEYAEMVGADPFDVFFDILMQNNGVASAIYFHMDEQDVIRIMKDPYVVIGSDGIVKGRYIKTHPRAYGTFPRAIKAYALEKGIMSLEEIVHKMTGKSARILRLPKKGLLRDGMDADLALLDLNTLRDTADYVNPCALSQGIVATVVGGQIVYRDQALTGACPGRVIRAEQEGL